MMIHGTTSGGAVPILILSYLLLASFVMYLGGLFSGESVCALPGGSTRSQTGIKLAPILICEKLLLVY